MDPEIANDKALRKDYQYDESRPDMSTNEQLDLDDEYAQLSGIVDPRVVRTSVYSCEGICEAYTNSS